MTQRSINDLPAGLLEPIEDEQTANGFLEALCRAGLYYHPDDDPVDCLARDYEGGPKPPLSELAAKFIGWQLRDAARFVPDIYGALMDADVRVWDEQSAFHGHDKRD